MLISQRHNIAFVHIPKCGGSTVRHQFAGIADTETDFSGFLEHPDLGLVRLGHLPLWAVRGQYPAAFELLRAARCFALCRDPYDRFESALSQHLFLHRRQRINDFSRPEIQQAAEDVIAHLTGSDRIATADYCHFIRQSDFVSLDGEQVVDALYPLSGIARLITDLSAATGVAASPDLHSNQTLDFKLKGSEKSLRRFSGVAKRLLPVQAHSRIKKFAKGVFTQGGSRHKGFSRQEAAIADFIASYYADDIALFASASPSTDPRP